MELKELNTKLSCGPSGVIVFVGPKSCGKTGALMTLPTLPVTLALTARTELLHELCRSRRAMVPRPIFISARANDCATPGALSQVLLRGVQDAWRLDDAALARLLSGNNFTIPFLNIPVHFPLHFPYTPPTTMQSIMDTYHRKVSESAEARAHDATVPFPIIILDEANRLAAWEDKKALQQLFDFFTFLTKEAGLAHVVLATSDSFFTTWLDNRALTSV